MTVHKGGDTQQREHSSIIDGSIHSCNHFGNQYVDFLENEVNLPPKLAILLVAIYLKDTPPYKIKLAQKSS